LMVEGRGAGRFLFAAAASTDEGRVDVRSGPPGISSSETTPAGRPDHRRRERCGRARPRSSDEGQRPTEPRSTARESRAASTTRTGPPLLSPDPHACSSSSSAQRRCKSVSYRRRASLRRNRARSSPCGEAHRIGCPIARGMVRLIGDTRHRICSVVLFRFHVPVDSHRHPGRQAGSDPSLGALGRLSPPCSASMASLLRMRSRARPPPGLATPPHASSRIRARRS
jgi:hypothetical protein